MRYVIAYDIENDKRRKKVADILEGYGVRVNYSVFEVDLPQSKILKLLSEIKKVVSLKKDSVRFYHISTPSLKKSFEVCNRGEVFEGIGGFV